MIASEVWPSAASATPITNGNVVEGLEDVGVRDRPVGAASPPLAAARLVSAADSHRRAAREGSQTDSPISAMASGMWTVGKLAWSPICPPM